MTQVARSAAAGPEVAANHRTTWRRHTVVSAIGAAALAPAALVDESGQRDVKSSRA